MARETKQPKGRAGGAESARTPRTWRAKPAGRYHHGDLKAALLGAALEILERDGPAALSLRRVARDVGVSPAAPYAHFRNKAALIQAVGAQGFGRLADAMAAEARAAAAGDALRALGRGYVRFAVRHPALFRLMFGPALDRGAPGQGLRASAAASHAVLADAVLARLRATGGAEAAPAFTLAAWALVHGLATLLVDGLVIPAHLDAGDAAVLADRVLAFLDPAPPDA